MNVSLIRCPAPFLIDERVFPPLGLLAVATALDKQGCTVAVRDDLVAGVDWYGVGPTTPEYPAAKAILDRIRAEYPGAKVMIGGPHATFHAEKCLQDGFDLVVLGDGECLKVEHLSGRGIIRLPELPLDAYPIIDRTLLIPDIRDYEYMLNGRLATTMVTARGCPYHCAFCAKTSTDVRFRSAKDTIREIEMLHDEFGYRALMFFDDTFILKESRVRSICASLERLKILWRCFVRADLIVKRGAKMVKRMAEAGCVEVGMGVESGSDAILSNINKGEMVSDIRRATALLHECGIRIKAFFILGLPGENHKTLEETRRLVADMPFAAADFTLFQPDAGSPIHENRGEYDVEWSDRQEDTYYKGRLGRYHSNVRTSALSAKQLEDARDNFELELTR